MQSIMFIKDGLLLLLSLLWMWTSSIRGFANFLRSMCDLYLSSIYLFAITQIYQHYSFSPEPGNKSA